MNLGLQLWHIVLDGPVIAYLEKLIAYNRPHCIFKCNILLRGSLVRFRYNYCFDRHIFKNIHQISLLYVFVDIVSHTLIFK